MPTMRMRLLTTLEALTKDVPDSTSSRSFLRLGMGVSQVEQLSDVGENQNERSVNVVMCTKMGRNGHSTRVPTAKQIELSREVKLQMELQQLKK